jgi:hypothetical protein
VIDAMLPGQKNVQMSPEKMLEELPPRYHDGYVKEQKKE